FNAIYNVCQLVNFAQGHFAMLAIVSWYFLIVVYKVPIAIALVIMIVVSMLFGVAIQFLVAEPLIRRKIPLVSLVIATLGAGLCAEGIAGIFTNFSILLIEPVFGYMTIKVGPVGLLMQYVLIYGCTVFLCFFYWWFLEKTWIGLRLRAVGVNAEMASLEGVNLNKIRCLAWCISAGICAIAGWLIGPLIQSSALVGLSLVIYGFVAAAIGGFRSSFGPLLGGILIGLLISFSRAYLHPAAGELAMFLALILILTFRPKGLIVA
ncbi:hypothetical protein LCGC14_1151340, partial [marine sediment metagenome]